VVLAEGADAAAVSKSLRTLIRTELSPRHVPGVIVPVPAVPRTLSGKKSEVPVKRILGGTPVEHAVSRDALTDPTGFDAFIQVARDALASGGKT
jgi:acetoacetyl-CoA synthetase